MSFPVNGFLDKDKYHFREKLQWSELNHNLAKFVKQEEKINIQEEFLDNNGQM